MNAFISYAIREDEKYILNLLAQKVAETGLTLVASSNQTDSVDWHAANEIQNCALFIGLMTKSGTNRKVQRVYQEFKQAKLFVKPSILLIEEGKEVGPWVTSYRNTIRFNRFNINHAVESVNRKIRDSQSENSNAAAWLIGGVAVLALLALLSDDKK